MPDKLNNYLRFILTKSIKIMSSEIMTSEFYRSKQEKQFVGICGI